MRFLVARFCIALALGAAAFNAMADAGELRAKYSQLREQLHNNPYHRPIFIDSAEAGDTLRGDIYAVLDHPYADMQRALQNPNDWCAILILPFNTKYCHPVKSGNGTRLSMRIGRKADQPVDEAYRLNLDLKPGVATPEFFESHLSSKDGPVGTRDYRIMLEAIPLDATHTFMHLSYSYGYGGMGRFAMRAYLATAGASKVGFSIVGRDANGAPVYIGGVRGAIERNVMRYYLAVDAHLASLSAPPDARLNKSIEAWFDSSERYARQLHEMDRSQYIALKKGETERQQALVE
ncbi:MAG TPA: hypothetical protein VL593_17845 [Ramlibacter sp.]|nr:hypothetical protein [Ramlibacter sp.]